MFGRFQELKIKHVDNYFLGMPAFLFLALALLLWFLLGQISLVVSLALLCLVMLASQFHLYRCTQQEIEGHQRQVQALLMLHSLIDFRAPFAPLSGWAATPEFAITVIDLIRKHKPKTIVELGSGVSSVLIGYTLEKLKDSRLYSLDHDAPYCEQTRAELQKHGLAEVATVHQAALIPNNLGQQTWNWYNTECLDAVNQIDMLIVDGPPVKTQPQARYPALPVLHAKLSPNAIIILDDADRKSEQEIVARWLKEFPEFSLQQLATKKGTAVLLRNAE